jgi:L-ribulose-5-phosphate 3-epimerase
LKAGRRIDGADAHTNHRRIRPGAHTMDPIERRTFLRTAAMTTASSLLGSRPTAGFAAEPPPQRWKKAFMLGGVSQGSPLAAFRTLKEAGFEGVELISPNRLDRREVLQARDQTGLIIHGVSGSRHWQDTLSDPDPQVVERGMAAIRQEFEDCRAYGGTTVLVVPAVVNRKVGYRDAYRRSQENIRRLIPDAEKHGVKIAIEEVWNRFLLSPIEFSRYIDEFESPWVGAYFDVGNVVEFGYPEEWIRELGKRILKIHIKEYAKPQRFSYLLGEGKEIDWAAVRSALIAVGYQGWITAEVPFGKLDQMKDVVRRMDQLLHRS